MEEIIVQGGYSLNGEIDICAAKNSVLSLLACCILCDENIVLHNVKPMSDIIQMCEIIRSIGGIAHFEGTALRINCSGIKSGLLNQDLTNKIRASVFVLGALSAKLGNAQIGDLGGCKIGARPIDLHIKGLQTLGFCICRDNEKIICTGKNNGGVVILPFASVGATQNLIMASIIGENTNTTIVNPAREPEIEDLQNFINSMGGDVSGAGTNTIFIKGVKKLNGCEYTPIGDRIIAGTYAIATAIAGGRVVLRGVSSKHFPLLIKILRDKGVHVNTYRNNVFIKAEKCRYDAAKIISTTPFPGFSTDLQSQMVALESLSNGITVVQENLFENRFNHVHELCKMGANICIEKNTAIIKGVEKIYGVNLVAHDLRGGAALVLAGLGADGVSVIKNVEHIDRGYWHIEDDLRKIGARIKRDKSCELFFN